MVAAVVMVAAAAAAMIAAVVMVAAAALNTVVVAVVAAMIAVVAKVAAAHHTIHIMMEARNLFPPQIAAAMLSVTLAACITNPTPMPAHKSLPLYIAAAKNSIHLQTVDQVISPLNFLFLSHEY
jgi:hypothetical protein